MSPEKVENQRIKKWKLENGLTPIEVNYYKQYKKMTIGEITEFIRRYDREPAWKETFKVEWIKVKLTYKCTYEEFFSIPDEIELSNRRFYKSIDYNFRKSIMTLIEY